MSAILLNICLTAIALCLFKMLLPEGALQKQTNFLIACFFLASMIFFFTNGRVDLGRGLNFDTADEPLPYIDFEQEYTRAQIRYIQREVQLAGEREFGGVLERENIFPEQIHTIVNISDSHCISISEVRLVFRCEAEQLDELRQAIYIIQKEVGERVLVTGEFQNSR